MIPPDTATVLASHRSTTQCGLLTYRSHTTPTTFRSSHAGGGGPVRHRRMARGAVVRPPDRDSRSTGSPEIGTPTATGTRGAPDPPELRGGTSSANCRFVPGCWASVAGWWRPRTRRSRKARRARSRALGSPRSRQATFDSRIAPCSSKTSRSVRRWSGWRRRTSGSDECAQRRRPWSPSGASDRSGRQRPKHRSKRFFQQTNARASNNSAQKQSQGEGHGFRGIQIPHMR